MRPLSIVQVCADRGIAPGSTKGAAQHLRGIAAGLAGAGHRVTTYAARRPDGPFPVHVHDLDELASIDPSNVDVVYERYSLGHSGGRDLAQRLGATFVLEVNAPLVREAQVHRPHSVEPHHIEIEQTLLNEADLVITVSTELTRWAAATRRGPTVTIPNGFEPAWFAQTMTPSARPTLAFIGHPKPWHGADRLPSLLQALSERGHRPRLLIIGGGPGAKEIADLSRAHGVANQITITGALPPDQASRLLTQATIGIAPYPRQESFYFCPLKIIDYLAAGLPIVSTRQGDIADLVGDAGVIVEPDDVVQLVDAIDNLLTKPCEAAALGANGRRRAHATMTWTHAAAHTAAAIEALDTTAVVA